MLEASNCGTAGVLIKAFPPFRNSSTDQDDTRKFRSLALLIVFHGGTHDVSRTHVGTFESYMVFVEIKPLCFFARVSPHCLPTGTMFAPLIIA